MIITCPIIIVFSNPIILKAKSFLPKVFGQCTYMIDLVVSFNGISIFAAMEEKEKHPHDNRALPLTHRRSLFGNYRGRGIYLVTVCTEDRQPLLGTLRGQTPEEAFVEPTPLGEKVLRCWDNIPAIQKQLAEKKSKRTGKEYHR